MTGRSEKDRDFDAYLEGNSPLSKAYAEEARELPPAHVDARILAEARRADAGPLKAAGPFSANWMVPVSAMAVIVLAVSVVALLPERKPGLIPGKGESVAPAELPEGAPHETKQEEARRSELEEKVAPQFATPEASGASDRGTGPTLEQYRLRPQTSDVPGEDFPGTLKSGERMEDETRPPDTAESPARPDARQKSADDAAPAPDTGFARRLTHIQALIEQGDFERARDALASLRRDYPNRQVPPAILRALGEEG